MKAVLAVTLFTLVAGNVSGQVSSDSLWAIWRNESMPDTMRLQPVQKLSWEVYRNSHPDSANLISQLQFELASKIGNKRFMALALKTQGALFYFKGDVINAINRYSSSLELFEDIDDKRGITACLNNIAIVYTQQGSTAKAIDYHLKSLRIREEIGDKYGIASSLTNIAAIYFDQSDNSLSLKYSRRSHAIFRQLGDSVGVAACMVNIGGAYLRLKQYDSALIYNFKGLSNAPEIRHTKTYALINIGEIYTNQGKLDEALKYFEEAFQLSMTSGFKGNQINSLLDIGGIYRRRNLHQEAIVKCKLAEAIANEAGFIPLRKAACKCLYDSYKAIGNTTLALRYHELTLQLNDSLHVRETETKLQQMEFAKQITADSLDQVEKDRQVELAHENEVRKKNTTKNIAIAGGLGLLILSGGLYSRMQYIRKTRAIIEKERDRSESLLLNILPHEIAQELKEKGKAEARDFENVSILFSDFKEFTSTSEKLNAQELVAEINICFQAFDTIVEKFGVEKIKTIGDAYMAAGGLPIPSASSAKNTIMAGLEMQDFMKKRKAEKDSRGEITFDMRVGIHTGPVVAGIVGIKKFQYDIWGDTVNTSSRIETNCEAGKVNISQATYELVKNDDEFTIEHRGKIQAKGKGELEMYFVSKKIG